MSFTIEEFTIQAYDEMMALWRDSEGVGLSDADSPKAISHYLARNPGMSFVAGMDGRIVGAVLCGHDGRRGYIHHLAVHRTCQRQGIGKALAARCTEALESAGIQKCHIFILNDNPDGRQFWDRIGWNFRTDIRVMSRILG